MAISKNLNFVQPFQTDFSFSKKNVLVFWAQDCLDALPVFQCSVDREQEQGNLVCALANQSEEREGREARLVFAVRPWACCLLATAARFLSVLS